MLKAQGMAQLVHSHQKDVIPWSDGEDDEGSLGPFPQTPCFPTRGFVFTPEPACHVFHPKSHKASQQSILDGGERVLWGQIPIPGRRVLREVEVPSGPQVLPGARGDICPEKWEVFDWEVNYWVTKGPDISGAK